MRLHITKPLSVLALALIAVGAPLIYAQLPSDEQPLEWLRWMDLSLPTASVPANAIVSRGNGSALVVGNDSFNNGDSGTLVFDENIPDESNPCGFAFLHDGVTNTLTLTSGCSFDPTPDVVQMVVTRRAVGIGIGRQAATNELEVEGDASKTVSGSWLANSDIAIKTDVQEIANALEVLNRLRPVRFRYNDAYRTEHPTIEGHVYANFVAQEFREVFPDSVKEGGDGLLQVDSYVVRPYLVAAVKELSSTVNELRAQNAELVRRLAALEEQVGGKLGLLQNEDVGRSESSEGLTPASLRHQP